MGLVNPTEVHPGVMRALYRLCLQLGPDSAATQEQYVGLLAPPSAVIGKNPRLVAERTVRAAVDLGVLVPCSGGLGLSLPSPPEDASEAEADDHIVRELRRLVLDPRNNNPLFVETDVAEEDAPRDREERLATTQSREFTRTQAWLLMRDPLGPSLTWSHRRPERSVQQVQRLYKGRDLVVNNNRWTNFRRWATFLGLSRHSADGGLIADPTRAVADELTAVRDGAAELPLVDLRSRLAERLPVLDGGLYREDVRRHVNGNEPARELSRALGFALLRCQEAGRLRLESRADFGEGTLTVGGRSYTHAVFVEAIA